MADGTETKRSGEQRSAMEKVVGDPVSRRKFMALTGGSAVLGAFLTACGSDGDSTGS